MWIKQYYCVYLGKKTVKADNKEIFTVENTLLKILCTILLFYILLFSESII